MPDHLRPSVVVVAEADQLVRMVSADILDDAGFDVIEVRTAAEAVAVLEGPAMVHVLITGRGIQGGGVELAHLVHRRWPHVAIIVTSGAPAQIAQALPPSVRLLRKPFDADQMIQEVRAGLDSVSFSVEAAAPVVPAGLPLQNSSSLGDSSIGIAAAPSEPDKS